MLHAVSTVTYTVHNFEDSCRVPEAVFGYELVDHGLIDTACAESWDAPAAAEKSLSTLHRDKLGLSLPLEMLGSCLVIPYSTHCTARMVSKDRQ